MVHGIAPEVIIILVKLLADYHYPATPKRSNPQMLIAMGRPARKVISPFVNEIHYRDEIFSPAVRFQ